MIGANGGALTINANIRYQANNNWDLAYESLAVDCPSVKRGQIEHLEEGKTMKSNFLAAVAACVISTFVYEATADVISDATTSQLPTQNPGCYIYTGYNLPYAAPRSIEIYWPINIPIDGPTPGTSTFSFWATTLWPNANPVTNIFVNDIDVGQVQTAQQYGWVTIKFPTRYLDRGANNLIEIWTSTDDSVAVACGAPSIDDIGEENAFYIRNNGGTADDNGPRYGEIYAKLEVDTQQTLIISPPSGDYVTTQHFDLTLISDAPGLFVRGGTATFNDYDVTDFIKDCIIPGTLVDGGQTFRCPGLVAGSLGAGAHRLEVILDLSDGSEISDTVIWKVKGSTEP
jgi:hypothetical protein